jgi:hypothetical protein
MSSDDAASGHELAMATQACCAAFAAEALAGLAAAATIRAESPGGERVGLLDKAHSQVVRGVPLAAWGFSDDCHVSSATATSLRRLAAVFALFTLEGLFGHVSSALVPDASRLSVRGALQRLCQSMRDDALALVEAFDFDDSVLCTEIGRADGDVYGHYLRRVGLQRGDVASTPSYWKETFGAAFSRAACQAPAGTL